MPKTFYQITKNEKHKIIIKPIKIEKRPGIMYCFGCKDFTHNFRPQEIKMTKKYSEKNQMGCLLDK